MKLYLKAHYLDEIGTGKDEFGLERMGLFKNGNWRPLCNDPVTRCLTGLVNV